MLNNLKYWQHAQFAACNVLGPSPKTTIRVLLIISFLCYPIVSKAYEYTVEGEIIYKMYMKEGEVFDSQTNEFEVFVKDREWLIKMTPKETNIAVLRYDVGSDGYDTYRVDMLNSALYKALAAKSLATRKSTNSVDISRIQLAWVGPGVMPFFDNALAPPVWLAYASTSYFQDTTNTSLNPLWQLQRPALLYMIPKVPAEWELFKGQPYLPLRVTYYSDGKVYSERTNAWEVGFDARDEPKPFDGGYSHTVYAVTATTNLGKLQLPLEFKITDYVPKYGNTNKEVRVWLTYEGKMLHAQPKCTITSFVPELPVPTDVYDYRTLELTPRVEHLYYRATNDSWLQLTNALMTRKYQTRVHALASMAKNAQLHKAWHKFFLMAFALGSALLFVRIIWKSKEPAHQ